MSSSQPKVSFLPVASEPEIWSIPVSGIPSATPSAAHAQASLPTSAVKPSLPAVAKMGPTPADAASPSRGSLQYLCDRLAQCNAEFATLDDMYIHCEEFVTSHKTRLADMQAQLSASRLDCETLRAANNDLAKN